MSTSFANARANLYCRSRFSAPLPLRDRHCTSVPLLPPYPHHLPLCYPRLPPRRPPPSIPIGSTAALHRSSLFALHEEAASFGFFSTLSSHHPSGVLRSYPCEAREG